MTTKIYTGVGDKGQTRLVDGSAVAKSDARVAAYGDLDELNSSIGLLRATWPPNISLGTWQIRFDVLQESLFVIGSRFACAKSETLAQLPSFDAELISHLESWIDEIEAALPTLKNFILPGGTLCAAHAHICRTVCRRAERTAAVAFEPSVFASERVFLNRLSDFFFVFARFLNQELHTADRIWKAPSVNALPSGVSKSRGAE